MPILQILRTANFEEVTIRINKCTLSALYALSVSLHASITP